MQAVQIVAATGERRVDVMPPLVPSFMMPQWLKDAPIPIQMALLLPGLIVGNILAIAVHAIMINLGAGNQHLSSADGGFDAWLLWIIIGAGLFLGLAAGGFVYIGVGLGADKETEEAEEGEAESGMLEL
ncbi:MAG: hypothetical protein F4Y69_01840 [Chloroflexi bacterium]|nr:hypothetical protein [Chloroflexota bacterium]MYD17733.1 hypothetical protein [Chloroflexota bacterium]MYF22182.1 hypothetical protein [Chloroflexota bacterium]MYJ01710.1 hypothetical protein [Chloroflexota bacterium]